MTSFQLPFESNLFGAFHKPLILLSMQPQYWQLVIAGVKKYEFRRLFRRDAVQAYIYLSSPRKEIAGFIDFGLPLVSTPERIAELAEKHSPGSRQTMLDYMRGNKQGFAVPILTHEIIEPIALQELREKFNFTAPQGYLVLDNHPDLLRFIQARHSE